ncbi:hypothetical protein F-S17_0364 [Faustovirus]|nr:hypothetical protein F-S17_0364 [Faustovirus]
MTTTRAIKTIDLKPVSYAENNTYPPTTRCDSQNTQWRQRGTERQQDISPRKCSTQNYPNSRQNGANGNPFYAVKKNIYNDLVTDNPTDVSIKTTSADKIANWHIVIGVVESKQSGTYVALGAFSFSNEKMPKKGREKVSVLPNGDKCTFMNVEVKFKMQTGGGLIGTIHRMFPGSQRPVKKGQFITNIVPINAQFTTADVSDINGAALAQINEFTPMVKFVYIKLIREIQRLYRTQVELGEVIFETAERQLELPKSPRSPTVSPIQTPTSTPTQSPPQSPTKSPVAAPSFADAVKKPTQPDYVMIPRDNTKPAATFNNAPQISDVQKIRTDCPRFYIIDAKTSRLTDLGLSEQLCIRK